VDRIVIGLVTTETLQSAVHTLRYGETLDADAPSALIQQASRSLNLPVRQLGLRFLPLNQPVPSANTGEIYRSVSPQGATDSWPVALAVPEYADGFASNLSLILAILAVAAAILAGGIILHSPQATDPQELIYNYAMGQPGSGVAPSQKASQRLVEAQESVRREVADYLHGHVQSKLLAVSMYMGICQRMVERNPQEACRIMERIQDELKRVQDEDLGQVSRELYPAIIKMGIVPALRSLVSRFSDGLEIDLSFGQTIGELDAAGEMGLPEKRRLGIYRIAEEALSNVMKHGGANYVQVTLLQEENNLVLTITDDGRGFEKTALDHCHGMMMMQDYASAIGGRAEITSQVRQGTTIRLILPLSTATTLASLFRKSRNPVPFNPGC